MSTETACSVMNQLSLVSRNVELIWHGGEPLLAGRDFFETVLEYQKFLSSSRDVIFRNYIQTNATLVDLKWVDIFKRGNFYVGVSIDGPEHIHNTHRTYTSSKGSFEKTMNGMRLLQDNGINLSALAVITRQNFQSVKEMVQFFVEANIENVDFLPCAEKQHLGGPQDITSESLFPGDFANFMNATFDYIVGQNPVNFSVRFLRDVISGLIGITPSTCTFNGTCGDYFTVDHDGTVLPCDNFVGRQELVFGHLASDNLIQLLESPKRKAFQVSVSSKRSECLACSYLQACGGGCSKYSYMWNSDFMDRNYFCGDRWMVFSHVSQKLQEMSVEMRGLPNDSCKATTKATTLDSAYTINCNDNGPVVTAPMTGVHFIDQILETKQLGEYGNGYDRSGHDRSWGDWNRR